MAFKDFRVESFQELEFANKNYREQLVSNGKPTHTFKTLDRHLIHCIEIGSQESIIRAGIDPKNIRFAPDILPNDSHSTNSHDNPNPAAFGMDGSLDTDGNVRSWNPDATVVLTTNVQGVSYSFTTWPGVSTKYYRIRSP